MNDKIKILETIESELLELLKYSENTSGAQITEFREKTKQLNPLQKEISDMEKELSDMETEYSSSITQRYQPDTFYGLDKDLWENMMNDRSKNQYRGYQISCAQLCGNSHYKMRGFMTVQTEEEFQAWLDENAPEEDDEDDW